MTGEDLAAELRRRYNVARQEQRPCSGHFKGMLEMVTMAEQIVEENP